MIQAPNFADLDWLIHGFGVRSSEYPGDMVLVRQIHSRVVVNADLPRSPEPITEGDALLSGTGGRLVGIKTADCVPILIVDPATRAVAAVHAGWRGSAENISGAAVQALAEAFGSRPDDLRAAIGPSIGACCYEVGPDVARRFGTAGTGAAGENLDLKVVNEIQLRDCGVRNIWKSPDCTFCLPHQFYSYRRDREQAGRMISFIGSHR